MNQLALQHIIYAPVPYKGYTVRARSRDARLELFSKALKEWYIPFDQAIITSDFFEKVAVIDGDYAYLARVFRAPDLDELRRSGVVSHIAQIETAYLKEIPLRAVDEVMDKFIRERGIPIGEIEPLTLSILPTEDRELQTLKSLVSRDTLQKILEISSTDRFRVFIVYKGGSVDDLIFSLARALSMSSSASVKKGVILSTEKIKSDVLLLYNGVLVIGKVLPPWARLKGWNIINLEKLVTSQATPGKTINDVIKQIYG